MDQRPLVKNAADPVQVKNAERKEARAREKELVDLRAVLAMPEGRRLLWRILEHCGVFNSVNVASSQIYANAGRQDVGHFVMAEIDAADQERFFLMMREHKARVEQQATEAEAMRTRRAGDKPDGE